MAIPAPVLRGRILRRWQYTPHYEDQHNRERNRHSPSIDARGLDCGRHVVQREPNHVGCSLRGKRRFADANRREAARRCIPDGCACQHERQSDRRRHSKQHAIPVPRGVTSNIQTQLNGKAANFSTDSTPTSGSANLVTSGGVFDAIAGADHVTPIHDGILSVSGNLTCAATLRADGSLKVEGAATFNNAVIAGSGYFQSSDFRHTGTTVSLGLSTGSGALNAVAIGVEAGRWAQSTGSICVGLRAGLSVASTDAICIGTDAGRENAGARALCLGRQACFAGAGADSVGIGNACGNVLGQRAVVVGLGAGVNAAEDCVCVGPYAGGIAPSARSVAVGPSAAFDGQSEDAIACGYLAAASLQSAGAVAIGAYSGRIGQGLRAVSIGFDSGRENQSDECVALGNLSGFREQQPRSVAIGFLAGAQFQQSAAIAIGSQAQGLSAGGSAIAIGGLAGSSHQGAQSICIGNQSGFISVGANTVAVGRFTAYAGCGINAVAIGNEALRISAGANCIGIGYRAGYQDAHARTITLNARTTELNTQATDACYIAPLRLSTGSHLMQYNTSTLEVTYSNVVNTTLSCAGVVTPSLSVSSIVIGTSIALPSNVQYVALRHSYNNTLTSGSTLNHSDASTFTTIVLGSGFGTWGSGISYRAAFDDTGYNEHTGSGVFTPPSAYGSRLFRVRCSITAALTGTAVIYLEVLKSGTVVTGARLPVANCTTTVETLVFVDGTTESLTFRLNNSSSGTWSLALTHTEPYLAAMSWELQ